MFDKIKQLIKDTAIYGVSTIIGRFLNFLLVPLYTHALTKAEFGIYGNLYAYIAFLNIILLFGMDVAFLKIYATEKDENKKNVFSASFWPVTIVSFLICSVFSLFSGTLAGWMDIPTEFKYLLLFVSGILFFDAVANIPFIYLRVIKRPVKFAAIKLINIAVNLGLNLFLIFVFDFGLKAILIGNLAASAVTLLLLLPEIFRNIKFKIDFSFLKQLLNFGLPYLPASFTGMMVRVIDRPLLTKYTDLETVGVYTAGYKLGIFMILFVTMFQYAWQPFFLENADDKDAKKMFSKVLTLFMISSGIIWLVLTLFIDDLVRINLFGKYLFNENFWLGTKVVPIILLGYIFNGLYVNFTAGIFIQDKTKYMPVITGIGAVVNIMANIILIPEYGMMGAAVAMLLSYFAMALAIFIISQKFYRINYEYRKIITVLILILLTGGCLNYFESYIELNLSYKFSIFGSFFLSLFIFKVIDIKDIKSIFVRLKNRNS